MTCRAALGLALLGLALLCLTLPAARVGAATAYVSDELVLGVYAAENGQGQRLATLHSGANVETLGVSGEFTQVRLNDGATGWVKSAYLTTQVPATVRVKQLEDELDRSRATTPALAEAAARSEVEQLKRALESLQSELDIARAAGTAPDRALAPSASRDSGIPSARIAGGPHPGTPVLLADSWTGGLAALPPRAWAWAAAVLAAVLAAGYWLGYAVLARRVRRKFGGIKVY